MDSIPDFSVIIDDAVLNKILKQYTIVPQFHYSIINNIQIKIRIMIILL